MSSRKTQTQGSAGQSGSIAARPPFGKPKRPSGKAQLTEVRKLLREGEIDLARRLAATAAEENPDEASLCRLHELLNVGRSYSRPATGQGTGEAFAWLRDPPAEYRGKWVALIGRRVVGSAETLKELLARLPPNLEQTPLAVQIAS